MKEWVAGQVGVNRGQVGFRGGFGLRAEHCGGGDGMSRCCGGRHGFGWYVRAVESKLGEDVPTMGLLAVVQLVPFSFLSLGKEMPLADIPLSLRVDSSSASRSGVGSLSFVKSLRKLPWKRYLSW